MSAQNSDILTHHALLVLWGQFGQAIGLVDGLMQVPLAQKTYTYCPQTKVLEFLLAVLAGLPYLKDLSLAAHPIDQDAAVAQAWGQPGWADHSGVSRTLQALTPSDVQQIAAALAHVSQPFVDQEVMLAMRHDGRLVFDADLTGRPVSPHATSYPGAAFGHMDNAVEFGYQAAIISLHSPTYGRLCLSATQHPGNTRSHTQLPDLVIAAEATTGARPWRRTDLLRQRLSTVADLLESKRTFVCQQQARVERTQAAVRTAQQDLQNLQAALSVLETSAAATPGMTSRCLQRTRQRLTHAAAHLSHCEKVVAVAQRGLQHHEHALQPVQTLHETLSRRLTQFEQDNASVVSPIRAVMRVDAGFGTGENIALLIEMGYEVYTKPCTAQMTAPLVRALPADAVWVQVGSNAEMTVCPPAPAGDCPYDLDVAVERFRLGDSGPCYHTLLHYGEDAVRDNLGAWFAGYNARQTIEAGIKEGKQVFQIRHLKVRTVPALQLQECFAAFAANFVRWAAHWLQQAEEQTELAAANIKTQVQVLAHVSALIALGADGYVAHFTSQSVLAGKTLAAPLMAIQWPLPFYKTRIFAPV